MAKGKYVPKNDSKTTGAGEDKVEWRGYVNFEMSADQAKSAKIFLSLETGFLSSAMQEIIEDGYSIKINWSKYRKGVSAGLYCQNPELPNAGYCLTQHSNDAFLALHKVLYVHFQILGKSWDGNGNSRDLDAGW